MIDKEEFEKASFEENQKLIKKILKLATHNAFTKDDLLLLIKWQNAIIEKMRCCGNCKHRKTEIVETCKLLKKYTQLKGACDKWEMEE